MSSKALMVNQNAVTLRDSLNSPKVKDQLKMAVPKWLSPDRLIRTSFSAIMKNPKLLQCSQESIFNSLVQCAELGLEPILGRAYLIPYWNSRTRVLECQFQPGYQGLIDLARRSNTIADVWGMNVYENDNFSINFGMNRDLTHRPWYMNPNHTEPGRCLGAYVVWQLKDGTKHPEFMPLYEIEKRRAVSQSYKFAETGDPAKGGGKRDSVWHLWPEDMRIKTVIKHSAKMVPASIEFMKAVELDNAVETGEPVFMEHSFISGPLENDEPAGGVTFEELIPEGTDVNLLHVYLNEAAAANETTVDVVKGEAAKNFDAFWPMYQKWCKELSGNEQKTGEKGNKGSGDILDEENWKNMRSTGFSTFVHKHKALIAQSPKSQRAKLREKWERIFEKTPWPVSGVSEEKKVEPGQSSPSVGASGDKSSGDWSPNWPDIFQDSPLEIDDQIRGLVDRANEHYQLLEIRDWLFENKDQIGKDSFNGLIQYTTEKVDQINFEQHGNR